MIDPANERKRLAEYLRARRSFAKCKGGRLSPEFIDRAVEYRAARLVLHHEVLVNDVIAGKHWLARLGAGGRLSVTRCDDRPQRSTPA